MPNSTTGLQLENRVYRSRGAGFSGSLMVATMSKMLEILPCKESINLFKSAVTCANGEELARKPNHWVGSGFDLQNSFKSILSRSVWTYTWIYIWHVFFSWVTCSPTTSDCSASPPSPTYKDANWGPWSGATPSSSSGSAFSIVYMQLYIWCEQFTE